MATMLIAAIDKRVMGECIDLVPGQPTGCMTIGRVHEHARAVHRADPPRPPGSGDGRRTMPASRNNVTLGYLVKPDYSSAGYPYMHDHRGPS